MRKSTIGATLFLTIAVKLTAQTCTNVGQTPESAFPVCGNQTYIQTTVPICGTTSIPVPCFDGASYQNKNPFWYKISCYSTGTIGFLITPYDATDDYDWQLFDATGHNPNDVFSDPTMFVSCNWSGEPGETGSSGGGTSAVVCAGLNQNTFSSMATVNAGHEYLLLVSHFTNSQSGYQLVFIGGNAIITDPVLPALYNARSGCDGSFIVVKTNKKIRCNSIAADGSDFVLNAGAGIIGASSVACGNHFDTDSIILNLTNPLPFGSYTLSIQDGTDANTLLDDCGQPVNPGNNIQFSISPSAPTPMDSISPFACRSNKLSLVFRRPIRCNSVVNTDFFITGPQAISVTGVSDCQGINSYILTLNLSSPLSTGGNYQLHLQTGADGNTIIDECGNITPESTINFNVYSKPSANFIYVNHAGCRNDTLLFSHDGNNGVNNWVWTFDNFTTNIQQNPQQIYSASSTHEVKLIVSNGACTDTLDKTIVLDNKVVADFETQNIICPEDSAIVLNKTAGSVTNWTWIFGNGSTSNLKDPPALHYPLLGRESFYSIKLIASNPSLGCNDSVSRTIKVLSNCFIAVPTAFTPNGDGINDYLYPLNALKADNLQFKVYNRWGQLVFKTSSWPGKWDGCVNGHPQEGGNYVWFLSFTHHDTGKKIFMKGSTVLIR